MPISKETFASSDAFSNSTLLDFFVKNKDRAYSLTELRQRFGTDITLDLAMLVVSGRLEMKYLQNDHYYHLKM
jgi:hypothetical protein